jgi:hypothetical protein
MTGIERRRYEMLVRVRNFGQTHASLFASSPAVQKTFALLDEAINELTTTDGRKLAAKTSARGDRKAVARRALKDLLTRVSLLSKNLSAEGRPMPALELPRSKSDVSLLSAGRQFAVDTKPIEAELDAHGMGPATIGATTDAFAAAVSDQGMSRSEHVRSNARISELLAAAIRAVRRLDLVISNALGHNSVIQAEWTQLRRLEDPRVTRGSGDSGAAGTASRIPAHDTARIPAHDTARIPAHDTARLPANDADAMVDATLTGAAPIPASGQA